MIKEKLADYLEEWDGPVTPFYGMADRDRAMEFCVEKWTAVELLEALTELVVLKEEWTFWAEQLMYRSYQKDPPAVEKVLYEHLWMHTHSVFFVGLMDTLPGGATLVDGLQYHFISNRSAAWKIAFLGVLNFLKREQDQVLVWQILHDSQEEEVQQEARLVLGNLLK